MMTILVLLLLVGLGAVAWHRGFNGVVHVLTLLGVTLAFYWGALLPFLGLCLLVWFFGKK